MSTKEIGKTYTADKLDPDDVIQEGNRIGHVLGKNLLSIALQWYDKNGPAGLAYVRFTEEQSFVYRGQAPGRAPDQGDPFQDFYDPAYKAITVTDARAMLKKFGMDQICIIAWNSDGQQYNVVSAGGNKEDTDLAYAFSRRLAGLMGLGEETHRFEDRREEQKS